MWLRLRRLIFLSRLTLAPRLPLAAHAAVESASGGEILIVPCIPFPLENAISVYPGKAEVRIYIYLLADGAVPRTRKGLHQDELS